MSMLNRLAWLLCGLVSGCTLGGLDDLTRGDRDATALENGRDRDASAPDTGKDAGPSVTGQQREDAQVPDARVQTPDAETPPPDVPDVPDAETPAPDAELPEPDAQTAVPDAMTPNVPDARTDAGPVQVVPTGGLVSNAGPCTGKPDNVHCDDFETGALGDNYVGLRSGWGFEEEDVPFRQTALDLVDDGPDHPGSRSLQVSLGSATPVQDTARLIDWLPGPPSAVTIDFDFKPSWTFTDLNGNFMRWIRIQQLAVNGHYPGVGLDARMDGIYMNYDNATAANGMQSDGERISDLFTGWKHVTLEVRFGANASVRVSFDGTQIYEKKNFALISEAIKESYVCFGMYSEAAAPSTALYDNVVVSYTP